MLNYKNNVVISKNAKKSKLICPKMQSSLDSQPHKGR